MKMESSGAYQGRQEVWLQSEEVMLGGGRGVAQEARAPWLALGPPRDLRPPRRMSGGI